MTEPNSRLKPGWLKELQLKSWEPEILLSGIVLYGMFQVPDALDQFLFFFSNEVYNDVNAMDLLVALLKVGVYWLILGLILHLICRGLWIGLVGLSYSFPKGIQAEKLKYQPKYLGKVLAIPSFENMILRLERICSIIYSVSFLLFMTLVGVYVFLSALAIIPIIIIALSIDPSQLDQEFSDGVQTYVNWLLIASGIGTIDFLTMGYFRRFRLVAKVYWPIYRVFSFLTLSRYYRPTYYAIVTNMNRWGLFFFLLVFVFLSAIGVSAIQNTTPGEYFSQINIWSNGRGDYMFEGNYQDREEASPSLRLQIPSDIIEDDVLRVFLPAHIDVQDSLEKFIKYDSIIEIEDEEFDLGAYYSEKVGTFYNLSIGDSIYQTKIYFMNAAATSQRGYVTYLNIGHLEEGMYELKLEGPEGMYENSFSVVPFYKLD